MNPKKRTFHKDRFLIVLLFAICVACFFYAIIFQSIIAMVILLAVLSCPLIMILYAIAIDLFNWVWEPK